MRCLPVSIDVEHMASVGRGHQDIPGHKVGQPGHQAGLKADRLQHQPTQGLRLEAVQVVAGRHNQPVDRVGENIAPAGQPVAGQVHVGGTLA